MALGCECVAFTDVDRAGCWVADAEPVGRLAVNGFRMVLEGVGGADEDPELGVHPHGLRHAFAARASRRRKKVASQGFQAWMRQRV